MGKTFKDKRKWERKDALRRERTLEGDVLRGDKKHGKRPKWHENLTDADDLDPYEFYDEQFNESF